MLDLSRIQAISLDLDDTLWPIWPTITRAEQVLHAWLQQHAPQAAVVAADAQALRAVREEMVQLRPDLRHDLSALRRESIRRVLTLAGEDPTLAEPAFEVFFEQRQRVQLFDDALPALTFLARRYPVVAVTNGNADVHRVGLAPYFQACLSAFDTGYPKPDVRIFHAAAQAVGVSPAQVLHVGDDAHLDGVGGLQAGMQVAWLNRSAQDWPHAPHTPHLEVSGLTELCQALDPSYAPFSG